MKGTTASRSLSVESKSRKVCSTQRAIENRKVLDSRKKRRIECQTWDKAIVFVMRWQRRLLHQPERGDGLTSHSRIGRQSHQGSGCRHATLCEMPHRCRGMDNLDSPSDTLGIRLSDNSRRMTCCERQGEDRQSWVLSVPILPGIWGHCRYRRRTIRVPDCTNSCSIPVRA